MSGRRMRVVNKLVNGGAAEAPIKRAVAALLLASLFATRYLCFDGQSEEKSSRIVG